MENYDLESLKAALTECQEEKAKKGYINSFYEGELKKELKHLSSWLHERNYALYLQSEEWDTRRRVVLIRDGFNCVICGEPAEHVHHLTYDRIFNEPLYDLVSVCASCHEIIHTLDKKGQDR